MSRSQLPQWHALDSHKQHFERLHLKDLFETDAKRFERFSLQHDAFLLDYSKQPITQETMEKLFDLAHACSLEEWRTRMFTGQEINTTEKRAVLHTALRTQDDTPILIDGQDIIPNIRSTLTRMRSFSDKIRADKTYTDIVSIGIGGSDLGASMAYDALRPSCDRDMNMHFVSNVDATHLAETLRVCTPEKTLFIIASKTFTTQETMTNAYSAKQWLEENLKHGDVADHFVAASINVEGAKKFGIPDGHIFPIWDWVGGRFSMWSAIGLPLCIALGFDAFEDMLKGAYEMDQHFLHAPFEKNMPVIMAMLGIWHRNFLNYPALSIVPYDQYLWRFPSYMQQVDMESNGKSVDRDGKPVTYETGPLILGEAGTNAQHAYFQSLHQGTQITPCDFIAVIQSHNPLGDHHEKLLANVIAQSKAMMEGRDSENPHMHFSGNRPSNTLMIEELTPFTLGMLMALYEHKIFVQGIVWHINSFDQCGVELGKVLANEIIGSSAEELNTDASTFGLLNHIQKHKK
ncbi:MAG: glucose-6-phosphate isomerase [Alphaproteobacteria bacterium]